MCSDKSYHNYVKKHSSWHHGLILTLSLPSFSLTCFGSVSADMVCVHFVFLILISDLIQIAWFFFFCCFSNTGHLFPSQSFPWSHFGESQPSHSFICLFNFRCPLQSFWAHFTLDFIVSFVDRAVLVISHSKRSLKCRDLRCRSRDWAAQSQTLHFLLFPSLTSHLNYVHLVSALFQGDSSLSLLHTERKRWQHTWLRVQWTLNICQTTDDRIGVPLQHSNSICLKLDTISPIEDTLTNQVGWR